MKNFLLLIILITFSSFVSIAQDPVSIDLPSYPNWGQIYEAPDNTEISTVREGTHVFMKELEDTNNDGEIDHNDTFISVRLASEYAIAAETIVTDHVAYIATEEWKDYIFDDSYDLISLDELDTFITQNHHLPCVPTAEHIKENGINDKEMNYIFIEKIEELTLYTIEQHKQLKAQKQLNQNLMERLELLESKLISINKKN